MKPRIAIKSNKKQWTYCIIELAVLILGPLALIPFADDAPVVCAVGLGVIFAVAIFFCVLCVKEGRVLYGTALAEYKKNEADTAAIRAFTDKTLAFSYDTANDAEKLDYLVTMLRTAAHVGDCSYFYARTCRFSRAEVEKILGQLQLSDDLRAFLSDVIFPRKASKAIVRYVSELSAIFRDLADVGTGPDAYLFAPNVFYDRTKHFRCRIYVDSVTDEYGVEFADYNERTGVWETYTRKDRYDELSRAEDVAREHIRRRDDAGTVTNEEFFRIRDLSREEIAYDAVWQLTEDDGVPHEFALYLQYVSLTSCDGHEGFLAYMNYELYKDILPEFLSPALCEAIEAANTTPENSEERSRSCEAADKLFFAEISALNAEIARRALPIFERIDVYGKSMDEN